MATAALTVEEDRRLRRKALYPRMHGPAPDCYRAQAEWWRIYAEESDNPAEYLRFAMRQDEAADRCASLARFVGVSA